MSDFKIGDVVQLKSGGPTMTVQHVGDYSPRGPNPGLSCVWFEGKKNHHEIFDPKTVVFPAE